MCDFLRFAETSLKNSRNYVKENSTIQDSQNKRRRQDFETG